MRAAEQDRPDVAAARSRWRAVQPFIDPRRLVFIDETGLNTKMARLHGRALRGHRVIGLVPHGHWKTSTLVCGLRRQGIAAPLVFSGAMTGEIFALYIREVLGPELRPGDIVVMDNLAAHKTPAARDAIAAQGAQVFYLPPYSPDLNPIELAFAKLKHLMRKAASRTKDELWDALTPTLNAVSRKDCAAFFKHAGYA